ncbi:hypothetical protein BJY01DRAFT_223694 [Aspergillus pseudoustus]|uniref:Uncharacterized protein n=1 Tax=Aspergillus pseudoustus TaxID=1810923 RepID=A0ABR4J8R2_9EURO
MLFVDGDRLLLRTMSRILRPNVYYLFDFGPRICGEKSNAARNLATGKKKTKVS